MKSIKYIPKVLVAVIHLVLLILVLILFLGRTNGSLKLDFMLGLFPDFYQHISNFCISYMLFSGIGFTWLLLGVRIKYIMQLGIAILLVNFVFELWVSVLNTPDIVDAYYGSAGTILAFMFLLIIKNYGLKANNTASSS